MKSRVLVTPLLKAVDLRQKTWLEFQDLATKKIVATFLKAMEICSHVCIKNCGRYFKLN